MIVVDASVVATGAIAATNHNNNNNEVLKERTLTSKGMCTTLVCPIVTMIYSPKQQKKSESMLLAPSMVLEITIWRWSI